MPSQISHCSLVTSCTEIMINMFKRQEDGILIKVGILTSGGDCQALNAAMRGVAMGLIGSGNEVDIYGFKDGYKGLINEDYKIMGLNDFENILDKGGTILGTSRMPFKYIDLPDENGKDKIDSMVKTYNKLGLNCLVVLGGNGSHKTANLLMEKGLNMITLPKTIDNDIAETDVSFGFYSAVEVAAKALENIRTTAESHGRIFVVELMGHKAGWMTLYAGIAAAADIILIPEIPYDLESIVKDIKKKLKDKKGSIVIAAAEGIISKEEASMTKKERKERKKEMAGQSVSIMLAKKLEELTGMEVRVTIPGHIQRGGEPCTFDKILATRIGARAARMILEEQYGYMVTFKNNEIDKVLLSKVAGKLKLVDPDSDIIKQARMLGIGFGD